jgi:hypothetical protein
VDELLAPLAQYREAVAAVQIVLSVSLAGKKAIF